MADSIIVHYDSEGQPSTKQTNTKICYGQNYAAGFVGTADIAARAVLRSLEKNSNPKEFLELIGGRSDYIPTTHPLERMFNPEIRKIWDEEGSD